MTPAASWTSHKQVVDRVRRRWTDGSLLRAYGAGEPFVAIDVPLRGPRAGEIGDDLAVVRAWVSALENGSRDGARYGLTWAAIGGRHIGRNRIPSRATVTEYAQAWRLLEVVDLVRRFEAILAASTDLVVRDWVLANPHKALSVAEEWPAVLSAYRWLDEQRGSGRYLREISAPGVDTKFAERHRTTLAALLGVSSTAVGFVAGLGLRGRPEFIRLRLGPAQLPELALSELSASADEVAALPLRVTSTLIVENEISYLSVDVPDDGVVIWGRGFEVDRAGRLPWLVDADVRYWGDLDTHGFAILDRLRAWLPQTRSVLMDRQTLLAHRHRWVTEDRPATSRLTRLSDAEREVYDDLVTDRLGPRVRLEQERIDWQWVQRALQDGQPR